METVKITAVIGVFIGILLSQSPATAVASQSFGQDQLECLALNIYWEGRSESAKSQRAIAHVTLNRVFDYQFPNTVCGVVREGGTSPLGRCQFSWWCDGLRDKPKNAEAWSKALGIARSVSKESDADPTDGALFYHHYSVSPDWAKHIRAIGRIGAHIFYTRSNSELALDQ